MKVLHVVGGNLDEGAAKGAYLLHKHLQLAGIHSTLLTNSQTGINEEGINSINGSFTRSKLSFIRSKIDNFYKLFYEDKEGLKFSPGFFGINILKTDEYKQADLVHLHWICNGFIDIKYLSEFDKPVVWTLRDMWPFTGGCHYSLDCDKFQSECGSCPQLGSEKKRDLSTYNQKRKERSYPNHITFIGISKWISDQAKKSRLLDQSRVETIPNNIDLDHFFPSDKKDAKRFFNLPFDKPILLFGSQYLKSIYKGYDILLDVLKHFDEDVQILYFGRKDTEELQQLSQDTTYLGFLDREEMRMAYTAADVFISASRAEAFGKTVAESMACGTPVVCFDETGSADIIDHQQNGYLAKPFDSEDMLTGIQYILTHKEYGKLSEAAIQKSKKYAAPEISKQYIDLYRRLLASE